MEIIAKNLLNGMNTEQEKAVKTTEGPLTNYGWSRFWKNTCINPSDRLFNRGKRSISFENS